MFSTQLKAYHMAIFSLFPILSVKYLSSSSPMKVLLTILFLVWNISLTFFEKGQDFWVPIFIIMLFNGGLMVLFLFTVSMIPKEKSNDLFSMPSFLLILFLFVLMNNYFEEKKAIGEFFYQNWWMVFFGTLFMMIYFMSISMLTIDFFKSIKSL